MLVVSVGGAVAVHVEGVAVVMVAVSGFGGAAVVVGVVMIGAPSLTADAGGKIVVGKEGRGVVLPKWTDLPYSGMVHWNRHSNYW